MILKIEIPRVSWHLVWIAAAFEGITVAILPYFATLQPEQPISKPPESGFLLGYIGMFIAVGLANLLGRWTLRSRTPIAPFKIHRPLLISMWGAIFLALIFWFQSIFAFADGGVLYTMLRAACALACSTLIVLLAYRWAARWWPASAITLSYGGQTWRIARTAMLPLVALVSLYEAIALPIIELVREVEHHRFAAGLFLGSVSGAAATAVVVLIYNTLSRRLPAMRFHLIVEPDAKT